MILCMIVAAGSCCFGAAAAIVSPAENAVIYADSLLISVKLTEQQTVRVAVYEEKESGKNEAGEDILVSANVAKLTAEDLKLISEFRTSAEDAAAPKLSDGSPAKRYTSAVFSAAVEYTNTGEIGFYTKQLSSVKPGLYRIQVETLGENEAGEAVVTATVNDLVAVKEKQEDQKTDIFKTPSNNALQFIQKLIKNIFK